MTASTRLGTNIRYSNHARGSSCLCLASSTLPAQTPTSPPASTPAVPAWAQPGSATHTQVAPPADFHRPSTTFNVPIGIFDGQSDVGSAALPGSATYDAATGKYTINSAGYNIWYNRDEFRFLWKKLSGDFTLAADVSFPDPNGYDDRKAVVIIRQSLDDNSKEVLAGLHGTGMLQFAQRPENKRPYHRLRVSLRRTRHSQRRQPRQLGQRLPRNASAFKSKATLSPSW